MRPVRRTPDCFRKIASNSQNRSFLLIFIFLLILYVPFLGKGFLTDDYVHIYHVQNDPDILFSPDPFRLYRPVLVGSFYLNQLISPSQPFFFALTNLLLHLAVVFLFFFLGRLLSEKTRLAVFACLAFAVTPKAHSIAVHWISGRSELWMALFFLLAAVCWLKFCRSGRWGPLVLSSLCYFLALLSKETAILTPVLFWFHRHLSGERPPKRMWAIPFVLALIGYFGLRVISGALMPVSSDLHYNLLVSPVIPIVNLVNYFFRSITAPLVMAVVVLPVLKFATSASWSALLGSSEDQKRYGMLAMVWFLVFIGPVLPIRMRSELYVYLAGGGFCFWVGHLVAHGATLGFRHGHRNRWVLPVSWLLFLGVMGGYIAGRNQRMAQTASFSSRFVGSLAEQTGWGPPPFRLQLVPGDPQTRRLLKDSISGYFDLVVKSVYRNPAAGGTIQFDPGPGEDDAIRYLVTFWEGRVAFQRETTRLLKK